MKEQTQPSRRVFLEQAGLTAAVAVGVSQLASAAKAPRRGQAATASQAAADPTSPEGPGWQRLEQTGWNAHSMRFVYAPTFTWKPVPAAMRYIVQFAHDDDPKARTVTLEQPVYDMSRDWPSLPNGRVQMLAWAVDEQDRPIQSQWERRFWKSPGFDGVAQDPADYADSVERNLQYLLAPARDEVREYERGLPRSVWSSMEDNITGQRRMLAYPALHHTSMIMAYLAYAAQCPEGRHRLEAERQAMQYGQWLLHNRLPAEWKCALFPYSTIQNGRPEGHVEGRNITLFRAARVGEAMLALFRHFKEEQFLAYARHLGDAYVELQRADGSWPYRVDPLDGRVIDDYTSNAVTPARLLGLLEKVEPDAKYAAAREKAAAWVLENPVRTRRWEGQFEDIAARAPYRNLQHYDTNEMIRYLVHYRRDDAASVAVAEELNRYIEDQFVVWQRPDRVIPVVCPTPTVLEQYVCYLPMEGHTARWMLTLISLHRATGNDQYLVKAINAGNSIVKGQQPSGAYSSWGNDVRFGRPLKTIDWPGSNANAAFALLHLSRYVRSLPQSREEESLL